MKLFNTIAYHSTSQKGLKKFDDTTGNKGYTGQGAQTHGVGLYLQGNKQLNLDSYYSDITSIYPEIDIGYGMHDYNWYHREKKDLLYANMMDDERQRVKEYDEVEDLFYELPESYHTWTDEQITKFCNDKIDSNHRFNDLYGKFKGAHVEKPEGSQYEVEIPDSFVFLEEDEPIKDSPYFDKLMDLKYWVFNNTINYDEMQNNIDLIDEEFEEYGFDTYKYEDVLNEGFEYCRKSLKERIPDTEIRENLKHYFLMNIKSDNKYDFVDKLVDEYCEWWGIEEFNVEDYNGGEYYKFLCGEYTNNSWLESNLPNPSQISQYLYEYGINGIHYNGQIDGECWVIFNCKNLKIIQENS